MDRNEKCPDRVDARPGHQEKINGKAGLPHYDNRLGHVGQLYGGVRSMKDDFQANELREDAILITLAGEAIINSIDRDSEFLLFYNIDDLLSLAKRIHVVGRAYKKKLTEQKGGNGSHG